MKKLILLFLLVSSLAYAQVPAYYSNIDFNQSGASVKSQLVTLITNTHNPITYADVWNVLQASDLETGSTSLVTLVYGYNDLDGNPVTDRTRDKFSNGGNAGQWNREHVFAKSLANPDLGTSGPGSDAHNIRAADVTENNNRASKKYATGSGNAGDVGANWYPGDEWRGDCARIIMYMYLRYGNQCIPSYAVVGTANSVDPNMVDLLLDWNANDSVSQFEKDRNDAIQNAQGNRNPFIDNPRIATKIWGGPLAEETWGVVGVTKFHVEDIMVYPTPVSNGIVFISGINTLQVEGVQFYDMTGKLIQEIDPSELLNNNGIEVNQLNRGTYILSVSVADQLIKRKIIIQ